MVLGQEYKNWEKYDIEGFYIIAKSKAEAKISKNVLREGADYYILTEMDDQVFPSGVSKKITPKLYKLKDTEIYIFFSFPPFLFDADNGMIEIKDNKGTFFKKPSAIHLLEPPRASGGGRESSLIAWNLRHDAWGGGPGRTLLLGDAMSERWARAHAIGWTRRITPPSGRLALTWSVVLRLIRDQRPEVIHCWSLPSLRLACALSRLHRASIRATLVEAPAGAERVIRASLGRIEGIETFDEADAEDWRRLGADARTVEIPAPHRETGSADDGRHGAFAPEPNADPSALRLGTLFDHPNETDARRLSFLLAILAVSEHDAVGLMPSGARHVEAGRRYARAINRDYRMLLSDRPLIEQLRVLDACVIPDPTRSQPRGARRLLEHAAQAAGVRAFDRPEYSGISGPTPPEMIRPMLDVLEGAA